MGLFWVFFSYLSNFPVPVLKIQAQQAINIQLKLILNSFSNYIWKVTLFYLVTRRFLECTTCNGCVQYDKILLCTDAQDVSVIGSVGFRDAKMATWYIHFSNALLSEHYFSFRNWLKFPKALTIYQYHGQSEEFLWSSFPLYRQCISDVRCGLSIGWTGDFYSIVGFDFQQTQ